MKKPDKSLIGASGVHFVCGELNRRGFIALPTIRNTRGIDISVISPNGRKTVLQVKTTWKRHSWPTPAENKIVEDEDYFFVFVNLRGTEESPEYYIVSSKFLKDYNAKSFKAWLKVPGKRGKPHDKKNPFRIFPVPEKRFKEKPYKDLLEEPLDLQEIQDQWNLLT